MKIVAIGIPHDFAKKVPCSNTLHPLVQIVDQVSDQLGRETKG